MIMMITLVAEVVDVIMSDDGHNTEITHSREKSGDKELVAGQRRRTQWKIGGGKNVCGFSGVTLFEKRERGRGGERETAR